MLAMTLTRLPTTFTSLYRLFLRTTSAAVLHHSNATRNLRRLYRPTFQTASQVLRRLTDDENEQQKWMEMWENRMDNTLRLLYNSAISRGLPHILTRNLYSLRLRHIVWWRTRHFKPPEKKRWDARRPPDPPQVISSKMKKKEMKVHQWREIDDRAWGALEEVVKMAEARHQISLGKIVAKRASLKKLG